MTRIEAGLMMLSQVLWIEIDLLLVAVFIAFVRPNLGNRCWKEFENKFAALSRHQALAVVLVGLATLGLRLLLLPVLPVPEPLIHDEFGYLLAADTFAHGHLTNPTHPMWVHFETVPVIHQPTYTTKYFPGQAASLAIGQILLHHPFWGVWLGTGIMCAAITWMLQGWFSPQWAFLGGILAVLRFGVLGYWANSYWGGCVVATGGALVLGALPRIRRSIRERDPWLMGIGLALMASSRPYEGLLLSIPVAILLFAWTLGTKRLGGWRVSVGRVFLPLAVVLALTAAGLSYYCWRTTGSAFRTPYQVHAQTYAVTPMMLWQPMRATIPAYRHEDLRKLYADEIVKGYYALRTPRGLAMKAHVAWNFFLGPALSLPLLFAMWLGRPRSMASFRFTGAKRDLLFVLAIFATGSALVTFYEPHYSAPVTGLILAVVLFAMKRMRQWNQSGVMISRAIPLICVIMFILRLAAAGLHIQVEQTLPFAWHEQAPESYGRAQIVQQLQLLPGDHLVIVHYGPYHRPFNEWVYNDADIDHSRIVWAQDMGEVEDAKLIDYFKSRCAWWLSADAAMPKLMPYREVIQLKYAAMPESGRFKLNDSRSQKR